MRGPTVRALCCSLLLILPAASAAAAAEGEARSLSPLAFFRNIIGAQGSQSDALKKSAGLQIIGAGASKTGTKSLQLALEMLGHKIYDMQAIMGEGHIGLLENVTMDRSRPLPGGLYHSRGIYPQARGDQVRDAAIDTWHEAMLEFGATATLDSPLNYLFEELLERNPGAKVILTTHPSGESAEWLKSIEVTWEAFAPILGRPYNFIFNMTPWSDAIFPAFNCGSIKSRKMPWRPWWLPWVELGAWSPIDDREACRKSYLSFNQRVRDTVPPGQLLEFNVRQGWEPLCSFLEVQECPSVSGVQFPRVNGRTENKIIFMAGTVIAFLYPIMPLLPLLILWGLYRCCQYIIYCCGSSNGSRDGAASHEKKTK